MFIIAIPCDERVILLNHLIESTTPSPVIDIAAIEPLLRDPHLSSILFPGLPAKKSTAETLASPAFKSALGTLVRAVESGQLESLLADGADLDDDVVAFLKSLKKNGMDESS